MPKKQRKNKSKNQLSNNSGFPSLKRLGLNNVIFPSVVRGTIQDSHTGATTGLSHAFFLNYPTYYRDGNTGSIQQMNTVPSLLANEQKVFDEYKVHSLKLDYVPFMQGQNFLVSYTTASGNTGVTNVAPVMDPTVVVGNDLDDGALFTSASKALNSQGAAIHSRFGFQPIRLTEFLQTDGVEKQKWLNLGAIIPNISTPPDPNNPAKLASTKVWTNGYAVTSASHGLFVCEWKVWFKGVYTIS